MAMKEHSFAVGENYLLRTVTHYYTGRLKSVTKTDLVLEDAAWIPDTGRFHDCVKYGNVSECEPFVSPVIVSRAAIVDATRWDSDLPREQK